MNAVSNASESISPYTQYSNLSMSPQNGIREIAASAFKGQPSDRTLYQNSTKLLYAGNLDHALANAMQMSDKGKCAFYKEALNTCAFQMNRYHQSTAFQKILEAFAKINLSEALYFCTKVHSNPDKFIYHLLSPSIQNGEMEVVFANYHRLKDPEMRKIVLFEIADKLIEQDGMEEAFSSIDRHFHMKQRQYFYINFMECLMIKNQKNIVWKIIQTVTFDSETQIFAQKKFLDSSLLTIFSECFNPFEAQTILQFLFGPDVHSHTIWKLYTQARFEFLQRKDLPLKNEELTSLAIICLQNNDLLKSIEIAHAVADPLKLFELICNTLISKGLFDEAKQCIYNLPDSVDVASLYALLPVTEEMHLIKMFNSCIERKVWISVALHFEDLPSDLAARCFAEKGVTQEELFAFGERYIEIESDRMHFFLAYLRHGSDIC